jgi:hypothetical protein
MHRAIQRSMIKMRDLLQQMKVDVTKMNKSGKKNIKEELSIWTMYAQEMSSITENMVSRLDYAKLPEIKGEKSENNDLHQ